MRNISEYHKGLITGVDLSEWSEYSSFEFAGVGIDERRRLTQSREQLLQGLTSPEIVQDRKLYLLLVMPATIYESQIRGRLQTLRFSELSPAVVKLRSGEQFLCSVENSKNLTDVEGFPDGIPFAWEEIESFTPTRHYVSLDIMRRRATALNEAGLSKQMFEGKLAPGSYE